VGQRARLQEQHLFRPLAAEIQASAFFQSDEGDANVALGEGTQVLAGDGRLMAIVDSGKSIGIHQRDVGVTRLRISDGRAARFLFALPEVLPFGSG